MNQKKILTLIYLLCTVLFIFALIEGCKKDETSSFTPLDDTNWSPQGIQEVVSSNNQFALELYSELSKTEQGNVFFSPYSLFSTLAILYEGAYDETAQQIKELLYLPEADILRPNYAHLFNLINKPNKAYELNTTNALWLDENFPVKEEYIDIVTSYYGADVFNLNISGDPEGARQTINSYIEEKTNGRIKDTLPPNSLNHNTVFVVTNTIYFKGKWLIEFDKSDTTEEDFFVTPDQVIKVNMMHIYDEQFNYGESEEAQILELPYKGEALSMLIILPFESLSDIEPLTYEKLNELIASMGEATLSVHIPKFKFTTRYELKKTFISLGMQAPFDLASANFSNISPVGSNLYITEIYHKAFIRVDEEGTEAAASSAAVGGCTKAVTIEFRADHPFIFIIQHKETGTILFMGKVTNPIFED